MKVSIDSLSGVHWIAPSGSDALSGSDCVLSAYRKSMNVVANTREATRLPVKGAIALLLLASKFRKSAGRAGLPFAWQWR
jgi:hypothetical protein